MRNAEESPILFNLKKGFECAQRAAKLYDCREKFNLYGEAKTFFQTVTGLELTKAEDQIYQAEANYQIACLYYEGYLDSYQKPDYNMAAFFLAIAVGQGHQPSMIALACLYRDAQGTFNQKSDPVKAIAYFEKAVFAAPKKEEEEKLLSQSDFEKTPQGMLLQVYARIAQEKAKQEKRDENWKPEWEIGAESAKYLLDILWDDLVKGQKPSQGTMKLFKKHLSIEDLNQKIKEEGWQAPKDEGGKSAIEELLSLKSKPVPKPNNQRRFSLPASLSSLWSSRQPVMGEPGLSEEKQALLQTQEKEKTSTAPAFSRTSSSP